jgi:DUF4097 and DUF4098 domain-containing protein YvlB
MKRLTIAIMLALMLVSAGCAHAILAAAASDREERTLPLEAGGSFSLENVNGDLTVRASTGGKVHLVAEKRARALDQGKAREALDRLKIEIESTPSAIEVKTVYPNAKDGFLKTGSFLSVDYTLEVPEGTVLKYSGVNGKVDINVPAAEVSCEVTNGSVTVEGAKRLSATTVNGTIGFSADSVEELSSTNGQIEGRLLSLKPGEGKVETVNGSVTVTIPAKAALRVEAENVNGSIRSEVAGLSSEKHSLSGDLNGGGATLSIETVNGAISVKSAG